MIKVKVFKQANYPVSSVEIKKRLGDFFQSQGVIADLEIGVSIVGVKEMLQLSQKYLGEKGVVHNVLSFPSAETKGEFILPPGINDLGEIVICFPKTREEAGREGVLVKEKLLALVLHGARHLMGKHHRIGY